MAALGVHKNTFTCINIQSLFVNEWMPFFKKSHAAAVAHCGAKENLIAGCLLQKRGL